MNTCSSIQGQLLDVTVVTCSNLKDTKVLGRQDPYVRLEYANSKFRTNTCSGGGKNPTFQEKFQIPLIEGLREFEIAVWSSKAFGRDDFIGTASIQLDKVLSQGYDDSSWPIRTKDLRAAGEVKLIMHYSGASKQHNPSTCTSCAHPPAPPYEPPSPYAHPHPLCSYPSFSGYPYMAPPSPPPPYSGAGYPPPHMTSPYHPAAYPSASYQPYGQAYPPPSATQPPYHPPPGPYPGGYPPPY